MKKWKKSKAVVELAAKAQVALDAGKCLRAGGLIDQAYYSLGRAEKSAAQKSARRAVNAVDAKFERVCVRARPK